MIRRACRCLRAIIVGAALLGLPSGLVAQNVSAGRESATVSIEAESDRDGRWILSDTEIVRTYPIALEDFKAVLEDYEAYPRFLPRLQRTTVLDRHFPFTTIRQRYEISILGYRYPTEYDLLLQEDASQAPARWTLSWHLAGSDGSIGESVGSWTLEADPADSAVTRVVHRNRGAVRRRFPLQLSIMRAVAERELGRSIDAVFHEARRRGIELARAEVAPAPIR